MLPGNVDPRRPDKVQRYKSPSANANGQGEDLTPDYMNILGQRTTTANATSATPEVSMSTTGSGAEIADPNLQQHHHHHQEMTSTDSNEETNATNVIPTSSQYGVAIMQNDLPATDPVTIVTDTVIDMAVKQEDGKDLHSTPSRNDRFKVVKIASLEPFKRGRWKCMDYVDEAPPPTSQPQSKVPQSQGSIPVSAGGGVYLQTQSLPQHQIQQMLLQSGYTNGNQFFSNVPPHLVQTYFYPPGANMQTQTLPQQLVNASGVPTSMPAQFINTSQPYFAAAGVVPNSGGFALPPNYQNVQYVPANLLQNQGSAFVPTSQTVQLPANFQQSQTYAGPNANTNQPLVNGHAYPQSNEVAASLPNQTAKSVILSGGNQQQQPVSQPQLSQQNIQQNQIPVAQTTPQSQSVPVIPNQQQQQPQQQQQQQQQYQNFNQPQQQQQQQQPLIVQNVLVQQQNFDQSQAPTSNVYTNPQFDMNVNSLTVLEATSSSGDQPSSITNATEGGAIESTDQDNQDPNKAVNAIDNKIEQAMDLVKSHLMYTVREEVEVLKEKIAELMEKIQQLESENNCLRSQIPKGQVIPSPPVATVTAVTTITSSTTTTSSSSSNNNSNSNNNNNGGGGGGGGGVTGVSENVNQQQ